MTTYNYDWKGSYHYRGGTRSLSDVHTADEAKAKIQSAFEEALKETALQAFTQEWAKLGRTLQVNTIETTTDKLSVYWDGNVRMAWIFDGQVTVTVQFTTDVAQTEHFSPQGWEELLLALGFTILAALEAHTLIAALIVLALVIGIIAVTWKLTGTSAWSMLTGGGGDIASTIFGVAVVVIGGLLAYAWLSEKKKGRRRRR
jgi:hypothetical protein